MFFSKIGEEQSADDAEDGPPELLVSGNGQNKHNVVELCKTQGNQYLHIL